MKTRTHLRSTATLAFAVLALTLVLAACGGTTKPSESPTTISPQSSPTGTLPGLKAYLGDAQDVLGQVAATIGTLPDAVSGMSVKPDDTWTASAAQLQSIASQLGDEASALAALQPPSALQPVQDAAVKGIEATQSGVERLAARLQSGKQKGATRRAQVQAQADKLKAQIDGLTQQLRGALGGLDQ